MQQGGTCILVGDDHKLIDETAAMASKALTCKIFKRKKFHKKSGFVQVQLSKNPAGPYANSISAAILLRRHVVPCRLTLIRSHQSSGAKAPNTS